jgi:hypothetical protein
MSSFESKFGSSVSRSEVSIVLAGQFVVCLLLLIVARPSFTLLPRSNKPGSKEKQSLLLCSMASVSSLVATYVVHERTFKKS